jgi:hypothetical protein
MTSPLAAALLVFSLLGVNTAEARIEPSFNVETATVEATHVVLVTQDAKREGSFRVVESWKGDLKPTAELHLKDFSLPEKARRIYGNTLIPTDVEPRLVTGQRIVVFLYRSVGADGHEVWQAAMCTRFRNGKTSVRNPFPLVVSAIWIEAGKAYAVQQLKNPGPARMHPLWSAHEAELNEQQVKDDVLRIVRDQARK